MDIPFLDKLDLSPEMKSRLAAIAASEGPELKIETYRYPTERINTERINYKIDLGDFHFAWDYAATGVYTSITYGAFPTEGGRFSFHRQDGAAFMAYWNGELSRFRYHLHGKVITPEEVSDLFRECKMSFTPEETVLFFLTHGGK